MARTSTNKLENIERRLLLSDVKILGKDLDKGYIYAEKFIVHLHEDGCIVVCFHVSIPPEDAAATTIIIKDTNKRVPLYIGESYFGDRNTGSCYFGKEAYAMYDKEQGRKCISRYIEEQMKEEYMMDDRFCGNC
jgi:hypothetical protein